MAFLIYIKVWVNTKLLVPPPWRKCYWVMKVLKCIPWQQPMGQMIRVNMKIHRTFICLQYLKSSWLYCLLCKSFVSKFHEILFKYYTLPVNKGVQGAQTVSCECNPCHHMMSCGLPFRICKNIFSPTTPESPSPDWMLTV